MSEPEEQPASLEIRLFGPFAVWVGGEPLAPLRSRKGQGLLALLALRAGREVRREWLADTLWPDSMPDDAQASLRQSLADLRRALGPEAARLQSPTVRTLRLDLSGADVDVVAFDAAVARGELAGLQEAVALYRGPLLEGCAEPWVLPEREQRAQGYVRALERLAERALADGDGEAAVGYLRRAAATDPLAEGVHRALLRALARTRQYHAALEVYQELQRQLRRELNAEPDAETRDLYLQIRAAGRRQSAERPVTPPLAPLAVRGRLPYPLTPLLGRDRELREVEAKLLTARLLTLTGPGGVGKTRLAQEVARGLEEEFADGACFVDLAPVRDVPSVAPAIGAAVGYEPGAAPAAGVSRECELAEFLRPRQLFLVLDNCEQVVEGAAQVAAGLLGSCPELRILATSRQRLGLTGEVVWPVEPLAAPPERAIAPEGLAEYPATQLFLERATAARPDLAPAESEAAAIARICRRLDGIPLAIELAAPLVTVLSVGEIEVRLEDRFQLLAGGDPTKPTRHQTLRAAVDWSYELLAPPERALLRRLASFAGSWSLAAAEAVCADPRPAAGDTLRAGQVLATLGLLVGKSLVVAEATGGPQRYRFLETLREYAAERLEQAGEREACRARHLQYFQRLAERAEPELTGREQGAWLRALDADSGNLRAALEWGAEAQPEAALALAASLGRYWQIRGYFREGRELLGRVLAAVAADASHLDSSRAKAMGWAGFLAVYQGDYAEARRLAEASAALCREQEDRLGLAAALGTLAIAAKDCGDRERSEALFTESLTLSRAAGDEAGVASTLGYLGILAADRRDVAAARAYYEESLALRRARGDRWGIAAASNNLGLLALEEGDPARARALLHEALTLRRELGDRRCIAVSLNHLGRAALALGDLAEAGAHYAESLRVAWEIGDRRSIAYSLEAAAGLVLARQGTLDGARCAVRLCAAAAALRDAIGATLSLPNAERWEATLAAARACLPDEEYAAAWAEGTALPLDESVALALAGVEPVGGG